MRRFIVFILVITGFFGDAYAAVARRTTAATRGGGAAQATGTQGAGAQKNNNASKPNVASRGRSATPAKGTVSARVAVQNKTVGNKPAVAARAATTQKVIGSGTKVATATKNVLINEECQKKYDGCMDSFCMLDNASGGRCICSNKNAELSSILAEIEKLDEQSYQMATVGVEKLEMGADADAVIANANAAAQSVINGVDGDKKKSKRRALDTSLWTQDTESEDEMDSIFGAETSGGGIDEKEGDALYRAASEICVAQIPECASDMQMLQMLYAQRVKSDCTAFENSLKQKKTQSAQKLAAAEQALRETALEQLRNANKYDLGKCTIEFKKCMQTTAECGEDFSDCAIMSALDATNTRKSSSSRSSTGYQIQGAITNIEISASTYDMLVSKKPLCESVTKSCVLVADKVWDTFLKDIAPQLKNAEIIAEDKARQGCIGSVSECFQKACKDNMDPKDPDGSYDMCLSRPETMLNVCKVPLNACGIDASSKQKAEKSDIWDFILARLASMRVDSCTTEVKECLQSEDRCGKDYTQCIGLDTDTIIRMCPYDKLTGCQMVYGTDKIKGDDVYDELANMVQGIMINIDNNFLTECQNAANEAMIKVCGDTENCNGLTVDDGIGARSLEYKICEYNENGFTNNCKMTVEQIQDSELGRNSENAPDATTGAAQKVTKWKTFASKLEGEIPWDAISFIDDDGNLRDMAVVELVDFDLTDRAENELLVLRNNINIAIEAIESDPKVQFCMTGREVQGMAKVERDGTKVPSKIGAGGGARFSGLTAQMRSIIAAAALKKAKDNYNAKYDELQKQIAEDYVTIATRTAEIMNENTKDYRREAARLACISYAGDSVLPTNKVTSPVPTSPAGLQLTGSANRNEKGYKETVTSTFNWQTLVCHRCVRSQNCKKLKKPLFSSRYCKSWGDYVEECEDVQF